MTIRSLFYFWLPPSPSTSFFFGCFLWGMRSFGLEPQARCALVMVGVLTLSLFEVIGTGSVGEVLSGTWRKEFWMKKSQSGYPYGWFHVFPFWDPVYFQKLLVSGSVTTVPFHIPGHISGLLPGDAPVLRGALHPCDGQHLCGLRWSEDVDDDINVASGKLLQPDLLLGADLVVVFCCFLLNGWLGEGWMGKKTYFRVE